MWVNARMRVTRGRWERGSLYPFGPDVELLSSAWIWEWQSRVVKPSCKTVTLNLTCAECGRTPRAGELWRLYFADIGEGAIYAERELTHSGQW